LQRQTNSLKAILGNKRREKERLEKELATLK
jgi:hypothetical protein